MDRVRTAGLRHRFRAGSARLDPQASGKLAFRPPRPTDRATGLRQSRNLDHPKQKLIPNVLNKEVGPDLPQLSLSIRQTKAVREKRGFGSVLNRQLGIVALPGAR